MRYLSPQDKSRYVADFSMFLVTAVWGFSFTVLKVVLGQNVSVLFFVFSRFFVAAVFLYPFCRRGFSSLDRGGYIGGIGVGVLIFLGFSLQSFGIEQTTASKAAFITGLASIFVPIYLLLHKRKLPSVVNGIAILAAMFGMYLLTDPAGGGFGRGDFLVLLCALAFGAQIYVLGIITRGRNPLPLTFLQLATTAILAGILLPFEAFQFEFSHRSVGAILFLGIFGTAAALLTQTWAQKKTSPVKIGLILTAEPLFAYLFASAILGDYFNPVQKIGGAIILAAVLAAEILPLLLRTDNK
ncbi:MAG: EamA family transporter [Candidatus Zixiibacteriota bacterium]|nr:MAG: EamA family transporter [candidate division Zixibacteria bacterium]